MDLVLKAQPFKRTDGKWDCELWLYLPGRQSPIKVGDQKTCTTKARAVGAIKRYARSSEGQRQIRLEYWLATNKHFTESLPSTTEAEEGKVIR